MSKHRGGRIVCCCFVSLFVLLLLLLAYNSGRERCGRGGRGGQRQRHGDLLHGGELVTAAVCGGSGGRASTSVCVGRGVHGQSVVAPAVEQQRAGHRWIILVVVVVVVVIVFVFIIIVIVAVFVIVRLVAVLRSARDRTRHQRFAFLACWLFHWL